MRSVKRMFSFTDFYLPFGLEFRLNSHFNWPVSDFYVTTIRATAPTTMFSTAAAKTANYKMPEREKERTPPATVTMLLVHSGSYSVQLKIIFKKKTSRKNALTFKLINMPMGRREKHTIHLKRFQKKPNGLYYGLLI